MIQMAMTVNQMRDRFVGHGRQFRLEPLGSFGVDGFDGGDHVVDLLGLDFLLGGDLLRGNGEGAHVLGSLQARHGLVVLSHKQLTLLLKIKGLKFSNVLHYLC